MQWQYLGKRFVNDIFSVYLKYLRGRLLVCAAAAAAAAAAGAGAAAAAAAAATANRQKMYPLLLQGHDRPLTWVQFNRDGDLMFTCGKV